MDCFLPKYKGKLIQILPKEQHMPRLKDLETTMDALRIKPWLFHLCIPSSLRTAWHMEGISINVHRIKFL